jgi:hypothetical protein
VFRLSCSTTNSPKDGTDYTLTMNCFLHEPLGVAERLAFSSIKPASVNDNVVEASSFRDELAIELEELARQ